MEDVIQSINETEKIVLKAEGPMHVELTPVAESAPAPEPEEESK